MSDTPSRDVLEAQIVQPPSSSFTEPLLSKQGLLGCRRQMLPSASIGSHIPVIEHPPSHPSSSPSFYPPSLLSFLLMVSLSWVHNPFTLLIPTHSPPMPCSPQPSDLTIFSAAGIHWLPSSGMNSAVHPQGENGYFKAYLASTLMSKKSHAALLMAVIWLQPPRLLGVCLYIAKHTRIEVLMGTSWGL